MNIAVLGTGNVGRTLGKRWLELGHAVQFGSRDPAAEKPAALARELEGRARVTSFAEAACDAEVLLLAAPYESLGQVFPACGDLAGKVLIDCTNPLNADFTGLSLGHTTSAAEQLASLVPAAHVVKAFNSVSVKMMADPRFGDERATLFYCGDDAAAKQMVHQLAEELGFEPLDAGPLRVARFLEPLAMLYIHLAFHEKWGSNFAFKVMRR